MKSSLFSDINLMAGTEPSEVVLDSEAINQNIASIFETPVGSKWFRPRIGSGVNKHLFEPIDEITASKIRTSMERAIAENGEFRIKLLNIEVLPDVLGEQYFVKVLYRVPLLESKDYTFQFNLRRI